MKLNINYSVSISDGIFSTILLGWTGLGIGTSQPGRFKGGASMSTSGIVGPPSLWFQSANSSQFTYGFVK